MKRRNNNLFIIMIFVFFSLLYITPKIFCQNYPIEINLQLPPPYTPYYMDYWDGKNNAILIIHNTANVQKRVKLIGSINGDNGITISTQKNYTPASPLILNPNESKVLVGKDLKPYFNTSGIEVTGIDKNTLLRLAVLPEGNYDMCFRAYDYDNNMPLSSEAPSGCSGTTILYPEAPILTLPNNEDSLFVRNLIQTPVIFTWIAPASAPITTSYYLQISEMPNPSADPNALMNSTSKFFYEKKTNITSLTTLPNDPQFITGKAYAWRVIAVDESGKTVFKNKGISEAWKFYVTKQSDYYLDNNNTTTTVIDQNKINGIDILIPGCSADQNTSDLNISERAALDRFHKQFKQNYPFIMTNNKRDFYLSWKNNAVMPKEKRYLKYLVHFMNSNDNEIYVETIEKNHLSSLINQNNNLTPVQI